MLALFLFFAAVLLDRLFRFKTASIVLKHQFRLYALRDSLRESAMHGKVKPSNWVFQYLDSSIAKSIRVLPHLSLWRVMVMMFIHRPNKERLRVAQEHLHRELKKPENQELMKIYLHYMAEFGFFLFTRHSTISTPGRSIFRAIKAGQYLKAQWRKAKEFLTEAPETSTLPEFCDLH